MISFEVRWDEAPESAPFAWGRGILRIDGNPFWFHEVDGQPEAIEWTWIELLEFLSSRWSSLLLEQSYPFDLVPKDPASLRSVAWRRWENYSQDRRQKEELEIYRFEGRHDLARAMRGISLPSLLVLREGRLAWICTPDEVELVDLEEVVTDLRGIGEIIASRVALSDDARAASAVGAWRAKAAISDERRLTLLTGLGVEDLPSDAERRLDFWELDRGDDLARCDSELAAAARFLGTAPTAEDRAAVLATARSVGSRATPALDALARSAMDLLSASADADPYEQGYALAAHVRSARNIVGCVDPEALLNLLNVEVINTVVSKAVDAVGFWGTRHGPAILVNTAGLRAGTPHGRRATLSHELCHLLVDRRGALPLAEVLGGRSPYVPERRANAFSAEFLLPRSAAARTYFASESLDEAIEQLCETYGVGRILAARQLDNNPSVANRFSAAELRKVERILRVPQHSLES